MRSHLMSGSEENLDLLPAALLGLHRGFQVTLQHLQVLQYPGVTLHYKPHRTSMWPAVEYGVCEHVLCEVYMCEQGQVMAKSLTLAVLLSQVIG